MAMPKSARVTDAPALRTAIAPLPANENDRLQALLSYQLLDSGAERNFDDITLLASHICGTPIALISLVDKERQWFKSRIGLDAVETPRDYSFCAHAILQPDLFIVRDAMEDARFADNPLVTGDPGIRFYAGMPLFSSDGRHPLGTLCVIDRVPRELSDQQRELIEALARQAQAMFDLRLRLRQEERLSRIDSLTGAANRRSLYESLEIELSRMRRHGRPFSLAYFDLDNMKQVNDELGHDIGDAVLRAVAVTFRKNLRRTDTIARMGGDEFAVLFAESTAEGARAAIQKSRSALLEAMDQNQWRITVSIGVVNCCAPPESVEEIVKKADELMYQVKKSGKNGIAYSTVS